MRSIVALVVCAACGGGGGDTPPNGGVVLLYSNDHVEAGTMTTYGLASASFATTSDAPCVPETIGDCSFSSCAVPPLTYHSAGDITITGAVESPLTLMPTTTGDYNGHAGEKLFSGGESLEVVAAGDEVPAFSASVTAPARLTLTAPTVFTIDRSQDLHVTWTGSSAGEVELQLSGNDDGLLSCRFAASDGSADIPAAALARIGAGEGQLYANTITEDSVDVGDWGVLLQASYGMVLPDESLVSFVTATYQ